MFLLTILVNFSDGSNAAIPHLLEVSTLNECIVIGGKVASATTNLINEESTTVVVDGTFWTCHGVDELEVIPDDVLARVMDTAA